MSKRITKVAVAGAVLAGAMGLGIAFAAWTSEGTGSGNAQAVEAIDLTTVDASADTVAQLYPGGTGDVKIRIKNDNPYGIDVTSIAGNGAITSDKGANCDASTGVTYTDQTGTFHVNANSTALFTLTGAVSMDNSSHNDCQGAIFTIPVELDGVSAP